MSDDVDFFAFNVGLFMFSGAVAVKTLDYLYPFGRLESKLVDIRNPRLMSQLLDISDRVSQGIQVYNLCVGEPHCFKNDGEDEVIVSNFAYDNKGLKLKGLYIKSKEKLYVDVESIEISAHYNRLKVCRSRKKDSSPIFQPSEKGCKSWPNSEWLSGRESKR